MNWTKEKRCNFFAFVHLCLLLVHLCVLLSFYIEVMGWITEGSLSIVTRENLELSMLLHLIESENVEALSTMLSIISNRSKQKDILTVSMANIDWNKSYNDTSGDTRSNVDYNYPALIRACYKNNFEIIRVFVSAGYRWVHFCNKIAYRTVINMV